jgi:hypothetical protein
MADVGEMAQFLRSYREWELHLGALEENVKYYFAHDLYKYARPVPVYRSQMQRLRDTDQET